MDKFTLRGLIYSGVSSLGFGYELFFVHPPRAFLIVMYGLVIIIGMICIFYLKDSQEQNSTKSS